MPNDLCIRDETSRKNRRLFGVQGGPDDTPASFKGVSGSEGKASRGNSDFRIEICSTPLDLSGISLVHLAYPISVAIETSTVRIWFAKLSF